MAPSQLSLRLSCLRSPHYWKALSITARSRAMGPSNTQDAMASSMKSPAPIQSTDTRFNEGMFRASPILEQRQATPFTRS